jgi:hypothetical protein
MSTDIFNPQVGAVMEGYGQKSRKAAARIPLLMLSAALNSLISALVMLFEYEVLYRVFDYLAGDDSEYWSPAVMGLTSFILVIAIHYLVMDNKNHPALRFINKIAGVMSIVYLVGIGLLLSLLIFAEASSLFDLETFGFVADDTDEEAGMIALVMANITSPIAKLLFSFGLGALALINVFVAHHAISKVSDALSEISLRRETWQQDKKDLAIYRKAKAAHRDIEQGKQNHNVSDDDTLCHEVAADVLLNITDALTPTLFNINNALMMHTLSEVLPQSQLDVEQLQKAVKPIQAITTDTLIKAMKAP